jgi:quercetin 2,3-dioxygenase
MSIFRYGTLIDVYTLIKITDMKSIFYKASERGHAEHGGWLKSNFSFSFAEWNNPEKIHFGALRVLNDDSIAAGGGFGMHPHDNMEIVTIPTRGTVAHKDSTGTDGLIHTGDVQIMSAGTGIRHSEYNPSTTDALELFQIWVFPKLRNVKPRYEQKSFNSAGRINQWQVVVSPDASEDGVLINQDARFSLSQLDEGKSLSYKTKFKGSGIYLFVINGEVKVGDQILQHRDALGISKSDNIEITASENAQLLAIEVPMLS